MDEENRPRLSPEEKEVWNYLHEVIGDYERYLADIDDLGLMAPNLLYYRDEIQEMLEEFKGDPRVDFRGTWERVKALDEVLRANQQKVVRQIGYANFKQYHIMNDPPRSHWWWFLNRIVGPPPPPPAWWQFWKKTEGEEETSEPEEASPSQDGSDGLGVTKPPVQGHG